MTAVTARASSATLSAAPAGRRPVQLAWLAAAVFVVSAGHGALLPGWLTLLVPGATTSEISRHVGFLSGVYAAGVLLGAPLWGLVSDRASSPRRAVVAQRCAAVRAGGLRVGDRAAGVATGGSVLAPGRIMFAQCSLVMLAVNALLFLTAALEKFSARTLIGMVLAMVGRAVMAVHRSDAWMYLGISLTSARTGLVLPVIAYLAAGASPLKLGATMGGLAAAAGFGQTLGSAMGGWLFGALAQRSFGRLTVPLLLILGLVLIRPGWWSPNAAESSRPAAKRRLDDP